MTKVRKLDKRPLKPLFTISGVGFGESVAIGAVPEVLQNATVMLPLTVHFYFDYDHEFTRSKNGRSPEYSPVFLHGRGEAIVIFSVWVLCLIWAVPFCYFTGYVKDFDPENFKTVLGMPAWLFWGILVPWIANHNSYQSISSLLTEGHKRNVPKRDSILVWLTSVASTAGADGTRTPRSYRTLRSVQERPRPET